MVRYTKPASLKGSEDKNSNSKERAYMSKKEEELRGHSELVNEVPDYLSDLAKEYYVFIVEELEISGILSNLDIPILVQTAETLAIIRECDEDIQENTMFAVDARGVRRRNPAVDIRAKAVEQFKQMANQLGMTPSSRASLAMQSLEKAKEEKDPLMNVLNKKAK